MRLFLHDALVRLTKANVSPSVLFEAVRLGSVEVISQRTISFDLVPSYHTMSVNKETEGVYINAQLLDLPSGFISFEEVRRMPDGFSQLKNYPYYHINKSGLEFVLYTLAEAGKQNLAPCLLDYKFMNEARILDNSSAFVDVLDKLQRRIAYDITIDRAEFDELLPVSTPILVKSRGRPRTYNDRQCNEDWLVWHKRNGACNKARQREELKNIYLAKGLPVAADETGRAEARTILELKKQ